MTSTPTAVDPHRLGEAHGELRARARAVAEAIESTAAETDRTESYPWHSVEALRAAGLMGMTIPVDYGGAGASTLDVAIVVEELAKACGATARIAVESNVGAIGAIMRFGTESQKGLAAELVLGGDKPAICISEPDAGSAAGEMTTTAVKVGGRYLINGRKHWITCGGVSKLHLIFARIVGNGHDEGIAGFVVVRDEAAGTPAGLEIGPREPAMGIRGIPERELVFRDLEVPEEMVVVPPDGLRRGFGRLMEAYNAQRVGAAAVALGIAEGAYEHAVSYSKERIQFGRPICEFQGLQWMLADMAVQLAGARALVYRAADVADGEFPDMAETAQAKIFAAETAIKVTNDALQIHGAAGYSRNRPLERMARDARMFTISGGTAQILRTQLASRILGRKLPQRRNGYASEPVGVSE